MKDFVNNQTLMISQLIDMEWKFGVTASTNTIDKFGNAFLQLKLFYSNGGKLETKYMGTYVFNNNIKHIIKHKIKEFIQ